MKRSSGRWSAKARADMKVKREKAIKKMLVRRAAAISYASISLPEAPFDLKVDNPRVKFRKAKA